MVSQVTLPAEIGALTVGDLVREAINARLTGLHAPPVVAVPAAPEPAALWRMLTLQEVAERLNVSRSQVGVLINRTDDPLPSVRLSANIIRVDEAALTEWIAGCDRTPASVAATTLARINAVGRR